MQFYSAQCFNCLLSLEFGEYTWIWGGLVLSELQMLICGFCAGLSVQEGSRAGAGRQSCQQPLSAPFPCFFPCFFFVFSLFFVLFFPCPAPAAVPARTSRGRTHRSAPREGSIQYKINFKKPLCKGILLFVSYTFKAGGAWKYI